MKEKDRKNLEKEKFLELTKATAKIMQPAKKDIETLSRFHKTLREGLVEEIFEDILGERNLLTRLERYGENSKFRAADKEFKYSSKDSNAESKRPSAAWVRSKVQRYEHEAIN